MNEVEGMEMADLRRAPAERLAAAVLPASAVVWTAAEIMRWTGRPGVTVTALGAIALSAITWGASARRGPSPFPAWTAVAGAWVTLADALGPLNWLHDGAPLTIAWAVIAFAASRAAHNHDSVVAARRWRDARAGWLGRSHDWRLGGSHLLDFEETRLGELYTISTKGTGKRASHFIGGWLEEVIAESEDLAVNRVRVMGHRLAGRIRISIRRIDPWGDVLLHPLVAEEPEIELPQQRTVLRPVMIGQDPEIGDVLEIPLCDEVGAKVISVVSINGGGKGVLLDNISEGVTAAPDALQVRINLSDKGYAEIDSWGPSCHLTAFGPDQRGRAVKVLEVAAGVIAWRARTYKRGQYRPSPRDPLWVVIVDESDEAAAVPAVKRGLDLIATKGREYGVAYVHAGQRGTADYGSAKQRSQDTVRAVGAVNRQGEARHAAGNAAGSMPDMASYGEGRPGVWSIAVNGTAPHSGRTWVFGRTPAEHGAEVEQIAAGRAFEQPEMPAACRAYLGETYEQLLETEVFPRWARAQGDTNTGYQPGSDDGSAPEAPLPALPPTPAGQRPATEPDPADGTVLTDEDPLRRWESEMDDRERVTLAGLAAKLAGARRVVEETAARPAPPEASAEALAELAAERWKAVGDEAQIPLGHRPRLMEMLADGTTTSAVSAEFDVTKWIARTWLQNLRNGNAAHVDGEKKAARWRLGPPPAGRPAPGESGGAP